MFGIKSLRKDYKRREAGWKPPTTVFDRKGDTVESTRIEPFLGENRVILDYLI